MRIQRYIEGITEECVSTAWRKTIKTRFCIRTVGSEDIGGGEVYVRPGKLGGCETRGTVDNGNIDISWVGMDPYEKEI